jgi:hypothetical protein
VREWLKSLKPVEDRKQIGVDIKTVEFGWAHWDTGMQADGRWPL